MVDPTVYYTPDSFGKSNPCDTKYILDETGPMTSLAKRPQLGSLPPSPYYSKDENLPVMTAFNTADIRKIMDGKIGEVPANLNPLLNDPILQRAIRTDPSVKATIENDPINFPPEPGKLIRDGTANTNNETLAVQVYDMKEPEKGDPFWLRDPLILFRNGNYYRIFPSKNMTNTEMLNALTRFFLYISILYLVFFPNSQYIYIPVVAILAIVIIYLINENNETISNDTDNYEQEEFVELANDPVSKICQIPTKGNPFMNITVADLMDRRNRPPACNPNNEKISEQINQYFDYNLFRNVEDVYDRGYEQRQFYTMPSTTIPNDQTTFAKWLYQLPQTCKENTTNCLRYEDIRYSRFSPYIDRMVPIPEGTLE